VGIPKGLLEQSGFVIYIRLAGFGLYVPFLSSLLNLRRVPEPIF